jgi:hypothetical protein
MCHRQAISGSNPHGAFASKPVIVFHRQDECPEQDAVYQLGIV